jgi:hypothetical protein
MTTFIAASDETAGADGRGSFFHAGFVAPESDWTDWFLPAWEERVLAGPPRLPYFHVTDARDKKWCARQGVTLAAADRRIAEAVNVASSLGSFFLASSHINAGHFAGAFHTDGTTKIIRTSSQQPAFDRLEPDHLCFLGFVFTSLTYVHAECPTAEKVHFIIERKAEVTRSMNGLHATIVPSLEATGRGHLARLVGDLRHAPKETPHTQAADLVCWHIQRLFSGRLDDRTDYQRYRRLTTRPHGIQIWENAYISDMAKRAKAQSVPNPLRTKETRKK